MATPPAKPIAKPPIEDLIVLVMAAIMNSMGVHSTPAVAFAKARAFVEDAKRLMPEAVQALKNLD